MQAYLSTLTSINEQIQLYDGLTNINNEWDSRVEMLFSLKVSKYSHRREKLLYPACFNMECSRCNSNKMPNECIKLYCKN